MFVMRRPMTYSPLQKNRPDNGEPARDYQPGFAQLPAWPPPVMVHARAADPYVYASAPAELTRLADGLSSRGLTIWLMRGCGLRIQEACARSIRLPHSGPSKTDPDSSTCQAA
jgi:hypothetical protein